MRRLLGLSALIAVMYVASLIITTPSTAYAQKGNAGTNHQIKIFPLEEKLSTSEAEINDWLKTASPKIIKLQLIPAHEENSALVITYEKKGTDPRTQCIKLFEQDGRHTEFERKVNAWLGTEKATIVAQDITLALHQRHTFFQGAYVYVK